MLLLLIPHTANEKLSALIRIITKRCDGVHTHKADQVVL